jgi:ElaB/YqjD/DUF883 family membrane-anchored ribosome-binding protein
MMLTASIEQTERLKDNISKAAHEAEERLTHFGKEAVRMRSTIGEAIEDGKHTARRAVKQGYRAAEDFVDDTAYRIKRDPLRALGLTFVAGIAAGWLLRTARANNNGFGREARPRAF